PPAAGPTTAPRAARTAAPRPPPIAAPSPAPSAVVSKAPPNARLLASAESGATCTLAYCWQVVWSAANCSNDLPAPGTTGTIGASTCGAQALSPSAAATIPASRALVFICFPRFPNAATPAWAGAVKAGDHGERRGAHQSRRGRVAGPRRSTAAVAGCTVKPVDFARSRRYLRALSAGRADRKAG